jgi:GntR family negative regulator for fad regulon and positive regulator of fabA
MPEWKAPQRPIDHVEESLVKAILDGVYAPGSRLPGERALSEQLGVTRPTLREALRRLERDGWLTIQQGKATRVNDFWREGGPNILSAMVRYGDHLPPGFVSNLLEVRCLLAPAYTAAAVRDNAPAVKALLEPHETLAESAAAFAIFDWRLHHGLTILSNNPIYTLILNGFAGFYEEAAGRYFSRPEARAASRSFYRRLLAAARRGAAEKAEMVTQEMMEESIRLWQASRPRVE